MDGHVIVPSSRLFRLCYSPVTNPHAMAADDYPRRMPGDPAPVLPITGERTVPGFAPENYWFRRHEAAYRWAAGRLGASPGPILEAGAGEGYGAALVAASLASGVHAGVHRRARASVIAVELDFATATHAARRYRDVPVLQGNLVSLPFVDGAFAGAVSLQVIEHIWDPSTYLRELSRCTDGPIVLSTPNRPVASPGLEPGGKPTNPFHVREFDAQELRALMQAASSRRRVRMFAVTHGSLIGEWERAHGRLPDALLHGSRDAESFAAHVSAADFSIEPYDDTHEDAAHDLLAIW